MAALHAEAFFKVLYVPGSSHIRLAVHKHTEVQKFICCCFNTSQMALVSPAAPSITILLFPCPQQMEDAFYVAFPPVWIPRNTCLFRKSLQGYSLAQLISLAWFCTSLEKTL